MKPTIHFGAETLDGETFFARAMRSASALADAGVRAGDRFAVMLRNEPLYLELMVAARWMGARWVPVNHHFKSEEVRTLLAASGARLLVAHADLLASVRDAIPEGLRCFAVAPQAYTRAACELAIAPDAAALESWDAFRDGGRARPPVPQGPPGGGVFFTSGTTGPAKGVVFTPPTPEQVAALMHNGQIAYGLEPGARVMLGAPLYHSGPSHYAMIATLLGCEIVLEPRFDAEITLKRIANHRITHLYLVPTMYVRLLRLPPAVSAQHDLSSVRFVASTGSACPPEVKRQMIEWWGPVIHEAYGSSEMGLMTHLDSADALRKPGSAGRPCPGVQILILRDDGGECAPGEVGTVYVRTQVTPEFTYLGDPEARRAAERDGAVTLGDIGYLDDEGFLFIVDRRADVVNSGGTKIYTPEIEAVLIGMQGVADAAVFGVPDPEFGEALVAAVQPAPGASLEPAQVRAYLRQRLAGFKVPRRVEFVERLPREDTGKLFKRRLRDALVPG